jgi:hypothetical protein
VSWGGFPIALLQLLLVDACTEATLSQTCDL